MDQPIFVFHQNKLIIYYSLKTVNTPQISFISKLEKLKENIDLPHTSMGTCFSHLIALRRWLQMRYT